VDYRAVSFLYACGDAPEDVRPANRRADLATAELFAD
jgi:hypothetical protein